MISRTVCRIGESLFPAVRIVFAYSIGLSVRYAGCTREFPQRQFGEVGEAPGGDLRLADVSRLIHRRRRSNVGGFLNWKSADAIQVDGYAPLKPEEWYRT
jgi:hypothetical protein